MFSPDGRQIAVGCTDAHLRIWDVAAGKEILNIENGLGRNRVAYSPNDESLASANRNGMTLWNVRSGKPVLRFGKGHGYPLAIAFSWGGSRIAGGTEDGNVRLWDAKTGREVMHTHFDVGVLTLVWCVVISPDGRRIAAGSLNKTAYILDSASGRILMRLNGHTGSVNAIDFSPDGKRVVTGSADGTVRLWDAGTGRALLKLNPPHQVVSKRDSPRVAAVAFSKDGAILFSGYSNGWAVAWRKPTDLTVARLRQSR